MPDPYKPCFYSFPYPMEIEQHEFLEKLLHLQNPEQKTSMIITDLYLALDGVK